MNQPDEDALWRSIVENYGDRAIIDAPSGPDQRADQSPDRDPDVGLDQGPDHGPDQGLGSGSDQVRGGPAAQADRDRIVEPPESRYDERTGSAGASGDRLDAWDDPDDHFVPPAPPPLPRPAPPQLLAWVGVFGVPALTVLLAVLHVAIPSWASLLGLVWFVGGFGFLVATMRRDRDDDDWDDGAVL